MVLSVGPASHRCHCLPILSFLKQTLNEHDSTLADVAVSKDQITRKDPECEMHRVCRVFFENFESMRMTDLDCTE